MWKGGYRTGLRIKRALTTFLTGNVVVGSCPVISFHIPSYFIPPLYTLGGTSQAALLPVLAALLPLLELVKNLCLHFQPLCDATLVQTQSDIRINRY
jgi:hypothetical protein